MFDEPKGPIEHFSWGKFIICRKKHSKSPLERLEQVKIKLLFIKIYVEFEGLGYAQ